MSLRKGETVTTIVAAITVMVAAVAVTVAVVMTVLEVEWIGETCSIDCE